MRQSAAWILENVVSPSEIVAPFYRTTVVTLRDDASQTGCVRVRGIGEIVVTVSAGQAAKIKLSDITHEKTPLTSLVSERLLQGVTPQDSVDLVAYHVSLK